jgi:hypothetical protein
MRTIELAEENLALEPVSRILFYAMGRFGRHFSQVCLAQDLPSVAPGGAKEETLSTTFDEDYRSGRKKLSFGAGKPDSVLRLAALRSSFLSSLLAPDLSSVAPGGAKEDAAYPWL